MARKGPPTDEERAVWRKFDERLSCMPCLHGEHYACYHDVGRRYPGVKCACEAENHERLVGYCTDFRTTEYGGSRHCGRPAKETMTVWGTYSFGRAEGREVEVERCGIHAAGLRRRAANDAKLRADLDAWSERSKNERANERASIDWVARLAELGIPATATREAVLSVKVDPERLYGMVREAVTEMDYAGIEHRFQPLPVDVSPPGDNPE